MLVVSALIGFFMTPFMVHQLGDKLFGLWALVGSFSGSYAILDLGLSAAVGRYVAMYIGKGDYKSVNVYVNTALLIYCMMGVAVILAAFGLTCFASAFVDMPEDVSLLTILILIVGTEFAISFPMRALTGTVTAKLRYDVSTTIEFAFKLVSTALIVSAILLGGRLISLALIGLSLGVVRGIVWYIAVRRVTPEVRVSPSLASQQAAWSLFSFSIFAFIAQIAGLLRFRVDNFVIGGFLGPASITHYVVAVTLTSCFILTTTSIMGVVGPVFAQQHGRDDVEAMRRTLFFAIRVGTSLVMFMAFGLLAWGRSFIALWMGEEYVDAYPCLAVITVGLTTALCQTSAIAVMFSRAQHHYFALANSVEGIANLVCSIIFVQYWGILGVALGTCIPIVVVKLTFQPWFVSRVLDMSIAGYFLVLSRSVLCALAALTVPAIITFCLASSSYSALFIAGALSAAAYFPVVAFLNLTVKERVRINDAIWQRG